MNLKLKLYSLLLFSIICMFTSCTESEKQPEEYTVYQLINGKWFNGTEFVQTDWFVDYDILKAEYSGEVDSVVDLKEAYVIPPFGEAHSHNVELKEYIEAYSYHYLKSGVFYVKNPNNIAKYAQQVKPYINHPESIDVVFSNGGLTATGGHPTLLYERLKRARVYPADLQLEGNAFFYIDSIADFEEKWPAILAGEPDFIKIILVHSDNFRATTDTYTVPEWLRGLNPEIVPELVQRIHDEGYRISAHIDNKYDFQLAVKSGIDEINHLPGYYISADFDSSKFLISDTDAALAADKGITVVTTLSTSEFFTQFNSQTLEYMRDVQRKNLETLKKHGVKIAAGSDMGEVTDLQELFLLHSMGVFSKLELLKIISINTPKTIFPDRKIGHLKDGYEASFLVLEGNPLEDIEHLKNINHSMKQGVWLGFK